MNSPSSISQRQLLWEQLDNFGFIEGLFCTVCHEARYGTIVLRLSWGHTIMLQRKQKM
ncbi:hypothetical protein Hanom_Chr11g01009051 [Helianthus anomalus]